MTNNSDFIDINDFIENYEKIKETNETENKLTLYEKTSILGIRTTQLSKGALPLINVPEGIDDVIKIAELELEQKKTPIIVKRVVSHNKIDYWKLEDLF